MQLKPLAQSLAQSKHSLNVNTITMTLQHYVSIHIGLIHCLPSATLFGWSLTIFLSGTVLCLGQRLTYHSLKWHSLPLAVFVTSNMKQYILGIIEASLSFLVHSFILRGKTNFQVLWWKLCVAWCQLRYFVVFPLHCW